MIPYTFAKIYCKGYRKCNSTIDGKIRDEISPTAWDEELKLPAAFFSKSDIQDYFEYISNICQRNLELRHIQGLTLVLS